MLSFVEKKQQWVVKFDKASLIERSILSTVLLLVCFLIGYSLLLSPVNRYIRTEKIWQTNIKKQIQTFEDQYQTLFEARQSSKENSEKKRLALQNDLDKLEHQYSVFASDLVTEADMSSMIENIVKTESGIQLKSLEMQQPVVINTKNMSTLAIKKSTDLFRQGLVFEVEGDFFAVLHFLQKLEADPIRIFWDDLEYQVIAYPKASVKVTLHTLGRKE